MNIHTAGTVPISINTGVVQFVVQFVYVYKKASRSGERMTGPPTLFKPSIGERTNRPTGPKYRRPFFLNRTPTALIKNKQQQRANAGRHYY